MMYIFVIIESIYEVPRKYGRWLFNISNKAEAVQVITSILIE